MYTKRLAEFAVFRFGSGIVVSPYRSSKICPHCASLRKSVRVRRRRGENFDLTISWGMAHVNLLIFRPRLTEQKFPQFREYVGRLRRSRQACASTRVKEHGRFAARTVADFGKIGLRCLRPSGSLVLHWFAEVVIVELSNPPLADSTLMNNRRTGSPRCRCRASTVPPADRAKTAKRHRISRAATTGNKPSACSAATPSLRK